MGSNLALCGAPIQPLLKHLCLRRRPDRYRLNTSISHPLRKTYSRAPKDVRQETLMAEDEGVPVKVRCPWRLRFNYAPRLRLAAFKYRAYHWAAENYWSLFHLIYSPSQRWLFPTAHRHGMADPADTSKRGLFRESQTILEVHKGQAPASPGTPLLPSSHPLLATYPTNPHFWCSRHSNLRDHAEAQLQIDCPTSSACPHRLRPRASSSLSCAFVESGQDAFSVAMVGPSYRSCLPPFVSR